MFDLVFLTLSAVVSSISCPCQIQLDPPIGLTALYVGTLTDTSLSVVFTGATPRLIECRFWVNTALLQKFIPQHDLTSTLESSANLQKTTLLKMG